MNPQGKVPGLGKIAQDAESKIIPFIRANGPVVPAQLHKLLNTEVLYASAMLAELCDSKKLKFTKKLRIGGSPLYFLPGQEKEIAKFSHKLGEKDKRTHDLLAQQKIIEDISVDPLIRVSLRNIPDFAVPLEVTSQGKNYLFWKYYTISEQEAETLIKERLGISAEQEQKAARKQQEMQPKLSSPEDLREQLKQELRKEFEETIKKEMAQVKTVAEIKSEKRKRSKKEEEQTRLGAASVDDDFFERVKDYFERHKIAILDTQIIRKNADLDLTIMLPTVMGLVKYYCKAKQKQKVNDADLSAAYVQGQMKKLPVLFLTTGDITKKAQEMTEKEFTTMMVKRIDDGR